MKTIVHSFPGLSFSCLLAAVAAVAVIGCGTPSIVTAQDDDATGQLYQETAACPSSCGDTLATLDGVTAYSNGSKTGTGIACTTRGTYGERYQCPEFAKRYWATTKGVTISGFLYACNMCDLAPKGWTKYTGTGYTPKRGDLFVMPCSGGTPYGHVAVVEAASGSSVNVVEQNWSCNGRHTFDRSRARCILSAPVK